jgi:uncharacterized repeat protein (TIGR01451 family)
MIKKLPFILLLFSSLSFSQGITVSTSAYTPAQLVTDVIMSSECATVSNVTSVGSACGIGYFNANGTDFPFAEGLLIRSGNVMQTAGQYANTSALSTNCSNMSDTQLQAISNANGGTQQVGDVTSLKFDIVPLSNILSFNFIFASHEYGQYQCQFGDVFAFLLTDLTSGVTTNLAVIPGASIPVSTLTIRNNEFNQGCSSVNPGYFGRYNVVDIASSRIAMRGQTVPMTAMASVIPNHSYSLKLVIGDYADSAFDSAVFIEGGSFSTINQCRDNIQMQAFVDTNGNSVQDGDEVPFTHGKFTHQVNNAGAVTEHVSSLGAVFLYPETITDTYDLNYAVDPQYAAYYSVSASYADISIVDGSGTNIIFFPVVNTAPFADATAYLLPLGQPRPGMPYKNRISYTNNGVSTASGTISFQNDAAATITEITQTGTIAIPGGFTYDFTNLLPNETRIIDVTLLVSSEAVIGQLLTNSVSITTPETDIDLSNNLNTLAQETVNSYDPNDKTESHGDKIPVSNFGTDDYLEYTIHFQNIGTAHAIDIRIEDLLDAQLDESTMEMLDASHNYVMDRIGSQLTWRFESIFLPGKLQSELLSQGYIHFRIKPKAGYVSGDIIPNGAGIYFDNNAVVETNTFLTEFVSTLGNPGFSTMVMMYPNPANTAVHINAGNELLENVRITDMLGKVVLEKSAASSQTTLDVSGLGKGIYSVEIYANHKKTIRKLIIQ